MPQVQIWLSFLVRFIHPEHSGLSTVEALVFGVNTHCHRVVLGVSSTRTDLMLLHSTAANANIKITNLIILFANVRTVVFDLSRVRE